MGGGLTLAVWRSTMTEPDESLGDDMAITGTETKGLPPSLLHWGLRENPLLS